MSVKATCGKCKTGFNLPDAAAGKSFLCKKCGAKVRVPDTMASSPEPDLIHELPVGFNHAPTKKATLPVIPLAIGGGAVVLLALIVTVVVVLGGGGETNDGNQDTPNPLAIELNTENYQYDGERATPNRPATERDPRSPNTPASRPSVDRDALREQLRQRRQPQADPPRWSQESEQDAEPQLPWFVQADPLAEPFAVAPRLDLNINNRWADDLLTAATPSPFIGIGENRSGSDKRIFIDLRTGKPVWELKGKKPDVRGVTIGSGENAVALSPDGQHLAVLASDREGAYAVIFRDDKANPQTAITVNSKRPSDQRILFSNNDQLLYMQRDTREGARVVAYDVNTGKQVWVSGDIEDANGFDDQAALSPGGRFLAFQTGGYKQKYINFLDTTTGQFAGRISLRERTSSCTGLSFSPDGSMLGGAFGQGEKIAVWDLTTGKPVSFVDLNTERMPSASSSLLKNFKLVDNGLASFGGDVFVDTNTGNAYSTSQATSAYSKTRIVTFLHGDIAIQFDKATRNRTPANRLSAAAFDASSAAASFALIETGADTAEANLPQLEETLYINTAATDFDFNPQAAETTPIQIATAKPLRGSDRVVKIEVPSGEPMDHGLSLKDLGQPHVTNADDRGLALMHYPDGRLFQFHTQSKRGPKEINTPAPMFPLWLSKDGEQMLGRTGRYRLSLVNINTGEVLNSWRVRDDQSSELDRRIKPSYIVEAALINGNRLWVRNSNDIACVIDTETNQFIESGRKCLASLRNMTADQRYLLSISTQQVNRPVLQLIDTNTAVAVAHYDLGQGTMRRAVVSQANGQVAVVVETEPYINRLKIFDLQSGEVIADNMLPNRRGTSTRRSNISWIDNRFLMIDWHIVDSSTGRYLWRFSQGQARPLDIVNGQSLWYTPTTRNSTRPPLVLSAAIPLETVKRIASRDKDVSNPTDWLIGPGAKVRLSISGVSNAQAMRDDIAEKFSASGLVIDNQAKITLKITQSSSSKNTEVKTRGINGERGTITEREEKTEYQWLDENGQVIWQSTRANSTSIGGIAGSLVFTDGNESAIDKKQRELNDQFNNNSAKAYPGPVTVPELIDQQLLGTSMMTTKGFEEIKPVGQ